MLPVGRLVLEDLPTPSDLTSWDSTLELRTGTFRTAQTADLETLVSCKMDLIPA